MTDFSEYESLQPEPLLLLIDGDPERVQQAARIISSAEYRLAVAMNVDEARKRAALIKPDLIIVDESLADNMLDTSGSRLSLGLENSPALFLLLVEQREAAAIEQAYERGFADFVCRPLVAAELIGRIRSLMVSKRSREIQHRLLEELQISNELINIMSVTDSLTGFYNHRGFMPLAIQQLKLSSRQGRPMMLAFMDIDGMKSVNDRYGHLVGDQLLLDCSTIIRRTFRDSDIIARIGGDEFAVLLVDTCDMKPQQVLERLEGHIDQFNQEEARDYKISLSTGIVPWNPQASISIEEMLSQADSLMNSTRQRKK